MTLTTLSWIAFGAYGVHVVEEYSLDWRNWARGMLGLPVEWTDFYVVNALVMVLGLIQAEVASVLTVAPLTFAALMLINATFFHVLPVLRGRGRFSPGFFTAALLFYPVALAEFVQAHAEGRLSGRTAAGAFAMGAGLMAYPIILLRLKGMPYFRQRPD